MLAYLKFILPTRGGQINAPKQNEKCIHVVKYIIGPNIIVIVPPLLLFPETVVNLDSLNILGDDLRLYHPPCYLFLSMTALVIIWLVTYMLWLQENEKEEDLERKGGRNRSS